MRYKTLILILISFQLILSAQPELLNKYNWDEVPVLHTLNDEDKKSGELILKELTVLEFFYDAQDDFSEYVLYHKITLVNSDMAIEMNNKIYLSIENSTEMLVQKARVINRDGSVHILKEEDIIEAVDEESKGRYKYFALEGLQKGCEIEYFYLIKTIPVYTGSSRIFQDETPRKNVEFKIYSPDNLLLTTKSLNGFPELKLAQTENNKNLLSAQIDYIPSRSHEEYAAYEPNLMQVMYKIDQDLLRGSKNIISYQDAANSLYIRIYKEVNSQEHKLIKQFVKEMQLNEILSEEEKIRHVEQYIKTRVIVVPDHGSAKPEDIKSILTSNTTNDFGITKLYALIYNELGINTDLVLTCNRNNKKFEKDFEAYHFLEQYLFYFPSLDKYMIPTDPFFRLGFIPYEYTYNQGLFIHHYLKNVNGNVDIEVKFIPALDYILNGNELLVDVSFEEDLYNPKISLSTTFRGLYAQYFQPYYDFLGQDEKRKMNENIIRNIIPEAEIIKLSSENTGSVFFGTKPLVFRTDIIGTRYIEVANNKVLFRIGELLGPQAELYQEYTREFDIESNFNRDYSREIKFNIPSGYKVRNLDALNMDIYVIDENTKQKTLAFISNYTISENEVTVSISEYYKSILLSGKDYEGFRKVINAAADFNKIALLFEIQ